VTIRDIVHLDQCLQRNEEERSDATYLVFPYRGVFVRHIGGSDVVAEPNQVLFYNKNETYRISHPADGGDGCLSLSVNEDFLRELVPKSLLRESDVLAFRFHHRRQLIRRRQVTGVGSWSIALNWCCHLIWRVVGPWRRSPQRSVCRRSI
jgi:hypothetical protein